MQMEMQRRITAGFDLVNGEAAQRIASLAQHFRARGWPVLHVRHRSDDPASAFHPASDGFAPMPCAEAAPGEAIFVKTTSSAFASTGLAAHLGAAGITDLVVVGAVAGFCVNTSVRAASDLGFAVTVARDAVLGFGLPGAGLSAQMVFDVTMGLLAADFAVLSDSETLLAA